MVNVRKIVVVIFLLSIGLIYQECTYRNAEELYPNTLCNDSIPDTISFSAHIKPILEKNCSLSGCHSGSSPEGNFNLEPSVAYAQLLDPGSGYVDTIYPRYSVVYSALVSKSEPMPPTGRMDQCSIDMIERWMKQGAKNN